MAAIRIIDDHLELASIGSNTHAQIDTHIAAADDYVKRDGSLALTADWDIGDTRKILADEIRARDGAGLKLYDDGGNGIFVGDGGKFSVGSSAGEDAKFFYDNDDVGDATTGQSLYVYRRAAEGDDYLRFYINAWRDAKLETSGVLFFKSGSHMYYDAGAGKDIIFRPNGGTEAMRVAQTGKVAIASNYPTAYLDVNSDIIRLRTAKTPATAGAAGNQGDICWDADYIYVCTATNSWERAAIAAW